MAYLFVEHPSSLEHDTSGYGAAEPDVAHPDQATRITAIQQ
jgi:hypothetical protein